eukprot:143105-Chlamydomonas_euryale.AAC.1
MAAARMASRRSPAFLSRPQSTCHRANPPDAGLPGPPYLAPPFPASRLPGPVIRPTSQAHLPSHLPGLRGPLAQLFILTC